LGVDDRRRPALAKKAEAVAARMATMTRIETQLVEEAKKVD
jgi:hypothetical protein